MESTVEAMTKRLTDLANACISEVDIQVNMDKTVNQHVHKRASIKVTAEEIAITEVKYKHKCDFCLRRFNNNNNVTFLFKKKNEFTPQG